MSQDPHMQKIRFLGQKLWPVASNSCIFSRSPASFWALRKMYGINGYQKQLNISPHYLALFWNPVQKPQKHSLVKGGSEVTLPP